MDIHKLIDVLRATLVPDQGEKAEQQLNEVRISYAHVFNMATCQTQTKVFIGCVLCHRGLY